MSSIPADLRYTTDHEYVKATADAGVFAIGITDYAQGELGDIVYLELAEERREIRGARDIRHDRSREGGERAVLSGCGRGCGGQFPARWRACTG